MTAARFEEWLRQADYDMETAQYMFRGKRYFYAVFMLHLSTEKALKGLCQKKLSEVPPKIHNLVLLLSRTGLVAPESVNTFLAELNSAHVATRYPDDLAKLQKGFTRQVTRDLLTRGKEALEWIRKQC